MTVIFSNDYVIALSAKTILISNFLICCLKIKRELERRAAIMGGGNFVVPVQTVTDFLDSKLSGIVNLPFPDMFSC